MKSDKINIDLSDEFIDGFNRTMQTHEQIEQELNNRKQRIISDYNEYLKKYGTDEDVRLKYWDDAENTIGKEDVLREADPKIAEKYFQRKKMKQTSIQKEHQLREAEQKNRHEQRRNQIEELKRQKEELLAAKESMITRLFGSKKINGQISDLDKEIAKLEDIEADELLEEATRRYL